MNRITPRWPGATLSEPVCRTRSRFAWARHWRRWRRWRNEEPFDLVFIDADKDGYVDYLEKTVPLVREGGLILADNTLPDAVLSANGDAGAKRYNTAAAAHPDLVSILAPMLRVIEGIDGLTISVKRSAG